MKIFYTIQCINAGGGGVCVGKYDCHCVKVSHPRSPDKNLVTHGDLIFSTPWCKKYQITIGVSSHPRKGRHHPSKKYVLHTFSDSYDVEGFSIDKNLPNKGLSRCTAARAKIDHK